MPNGCRVRSSTGMVATMRSFWISRISMPSASANPRDANARRSSMGSFTIPCSALVGGVPRLRLGGFQALEVLSLEFVEQRVGKQLVGDFRDLLGIAPGGLQRFKL